MDGWTGLARYLHAQRPSEAGVGDATQGKGGAWWFQRRGRQEKTKEQLFGERVSVSVSLDSRCVGAAGGR